MWKKIVCACLLHLFLCIHMRMLYESLVEVGVADFAETLRVELDTCEILRQQLQDEFCVWSVLQ